MYEKFYGLKENPFNITPDPNFIYLSKCHQEALSYLLYGIRERKGFIAITGDIGTGKTTLCRALLNQLDKDTRTAFILNSRLPELQLLSAIVEDFGIRTKKNTKLSLLASLNKFLIRELSLGHNVVLIIDEAQNLKNTTLEEVRLLSNLETEKEKLFQIVLVGQPELREKLNSPFLKQLRQRISIRYHIPPLERSEVVQYIFHRLKVAGSDGSIMFNDNAIDEIFNHSKGVPRLINILCDRALLAGYVMETMDITGNIIQRCIKEIEG
jgi:general secretion pathway protein A